MCSLARTYLDTLNCSLGGHGCWCWCEICIGVVLGVGLNKFDFCVEKKRRVEKTAKYGTIRGFLGYGRWIQDEFAKRQREILWLLLLQHPDTTHATSQSRTGYAAMSWFFTLANQRRPNKISSKVEHQLISKAWRGVQQTTDKMGTFLRQDSWRNHRVNVSTNDTSKDHVILSIRGRSQALGKSHMKHPTTVQDRLWTHIKHIICLWHTAIITLDYQFKLFAHEEDPFLNHHNPNNVIWCRLCGSKFHYNFTITQELNTNIT